VCTFPTNRVKLTTEPTYDESIVKTSFSGGADTGLVGTDDGADHDNLYNDALQIIKDTNKASASLLQRRLSIGYARAARILDILEEHGMIGPANGAKPREIYNSENENE
jgi:S-DNA-T family DNA segregation ATPase FtsK/SpoIIIE